MSDMNLRKWQSMSPEEREAHSEIVENRRHEAFRLHCQGHSYSEIGRRLDVTTAQARHDVLKAADQVSEEELQDMARQRAIEFGRIETLIEQVLPNAATDKDMMRAAAFLMTRKSKLLGLDAPTKFQHQVQHVRPKREVPREEIDKKLVELFDRLEKRAKNIDPRLRARVEQIRAAQTTVIDVTPVTPGSQGTGPEGERGGAIDAVGDPTDSRKIPD